VRFYERMEVRDLLAYCKALVNPADTLNLKRIINVPRRGIGKASFERLEIAAAARNVPVIDLIRAGDHGLPTTASRRCAEFLKVFDKLKKVAEDGKAPFAVEAIIEEVGYKEHLKAGYTDSDARIENVDEFVNAAHVFAENAEDQSLRAFLEEVALVADVDSLDTEQGQLTLMTLHNAKGLEFDCVIVAGLEEGLFPHANSMNSDRELEEERRLFYVGMTRARRRLYLSHANMRRKMGHIEGVKPSRFLYEVPENCLEHSIGRPVAPAGGLFGDDLQPFVAGVGRRTRRFDGEEPPQLQPDYESISQEEVEGYRVGMRIRHDAFGAGVVRRVEGHGEQTRVTVIFDTGGERKFLAHFAPMRPV
jgi:DNA helicase-2/ATP-dependent DNA helicase PcrA